MVWITAWHLDLSKCNVVECLIWWFCRTLRGRSPSISINPLRCRSSSNNRSKNSLREKNLNPPRSKNLNRIVKNNRTKNTLSGRNLNPPRSRNLNGRGKSNDNNRSKNLKLRRRLWVARFFKNLSDSLLCMSIVEVEQIQVYFLYVVIVACDVLCPLLIFLLKTLFIFLVVIESMIIMELSGVWHDKHIHKAQKKHHQAYQV